MLRWPKHLLFRQRDKGTDRGTDRGTYRGTDRGTDRRTDKGTDKGTDRGTDKGTDRGTDKGIDKGTDRGTAGGMAYLVTVVWKKDRLTDGGMTRQVCRYTYKVKSRQAQTGRQAGGQIIRQTNNQRLISILYTHTSQLSIAHSSCSLITPLPRHLT